MVKIYNTLTRKNQEFIPLNKGEVKMYACGVTPYDEIHVGHARQAVIFDVIRNYFEFLGYGVTYVRNFTDIDDKIINRANKENKQAIEVSAYYIEETKKDLRKIKVNDATYEPKVSECIADIIKFIQELIDGENAYVANGEVLFAVDSFPEYGKLSHRNKDELLSTENSPNKKKNYDFSLWKPAKVGEPFWASPWGPGRPGWHIECSVMINKYLGDTIDIHGGGIDLIFPHHENEIAQSEAHNKKEFARYWIHNGLVMVDGVKMSKSLGNFLTLKDALKKYYPEEIRYILLTQNLSSEMDISSNLFLNARKRMFYFYKALLRADNFSTDSVGTADIEKLPNSIKDIEDDFISAMDDNFNTVKVFANISEAFNALNEIMGSNKYSKEEQNGFVAYFKNKLKIISDILHIFEENPREYMHKLENDILLENNISRDVILSKIGERKNAKLNKEYAKADEIRNDLLAKKINLKDLGDNVEWEVIID